MSYRIIPVSIKACNDELYKFPKLQKLSRIAFTFVLVERIKERNQNALANPTATRTRHSASPQTMFANPLPDRGMSHASNFGSGFNGQQFFFFHDFQ